MEKQNIVLSKDELKALAEDVVTKTLTGLGFDTAHPLNVQRDLQYLRDWRHTTESIRGKAIVVAVGIAVVGLCGILWLGFKTLLHFR